MKTSLEPAFNRLSRYLVKSLRLGMPLIEAAPQDLRQSHQELHFQPEAGNEILKEFWLKLTSIALQSHFLREFVRLCRCSQYPKSIKYSASVLSAIPNKNSPLRQCFSLGAGRFLLIMYH
ncbi:hypothetical protein [Nostoc sp.]|uniref:hypothetical protein n=1 Tax=Nostoc sp. TaxID=1180 RepID=UPI002FF6DC98